MAANAATFPATPGTRGWNVSGRENASDDKRIDPVSTVGEYVGHPAQHIGLDSKIRFATASGSSALPSAASKRFSAASASALRCSRMFAQAIAS